MKIKYLPTEEDMELLFSMPERIDVEVAKSYGEQLRGCVAIDTFYQDMFCFKAEYDFKITYDKNGMVMFDRDHSSVDVGKLDEIITNVVTDHSVDHTIIQILTNATFIADKQCTMTIIPPIFHMQKNPDLWNNIRMVAGKFNIYDWQRPITFAFEWVNTNKTLTVKKGTPLFYVYFNSENLDDKFSIEKTKDREKYVSLLKRCMGSRGLIVRGTRGLISRNKHMRDEESKCPYTKFKRKLGL